MAYRLAPFNPTTPYDNQVITELNYANENFTILGQAFYNNDPSSQPILRASYVGPSAPSNPVSGTTWLNTSVNPPVIMVYGNNWQSNAVNSDTVDGFHASQTPAPDTLLPLNANARIYDYVPRGSIIFDPPDFTMSNSTEHFIGSVNITTPSWSPSGAWKLIFVVRSKFLSSSSGINNFIHRIKTTSYVIEGAYWYWNASNGGHGLGVSDCFLIPDLPNGTTQQFEFYVQQEGGNAYAIFFYMSVEWYLFPA